MLSLGFINGPHSGYIAILFLCICIKALGCLINPFDCVNLFLGICCHNCSCPSAGTPVLAPLWACLFQASAVRRRARNWQPLRSNSLSCLLKPCLFFSHSRWACGCLALGLGNTCGYMTSVHPLLPTLGTKAGSLAPCSKIWSIVPLSWPNLFLPHLRQLWGIVWNLCLFIEIIASSFMECLFCVFLPFFRFDYTFCRSLPLLALFLMDLPGDTPLFKANWKCSANGYIRIPLAKVRSCERFLGHKVIKW